jgi:hypothetical protein
MYWCCKGDCDEILKTKYEAMYPECLDGWFDVSDRSIPTVFIRWVVGMVNSLTSGIKYSPTTKEKVTELLLELFPYVSRELTTKEKERLATLMTIPSYFGGLGE